MKKLIFFLLIFRSAQLFAQEDTLYLVEQEGSGLPAYVNSAGDTIIEAGIYQACFTDVFVDYAVVIPNNDGGWRAVAIDRTGRELFEVYWYDNGPDFIEEGLFRIVKDGKIGYADEDYKIVIEPKFACADPFMEGKARVTMECVRKAEGEFVREISDSWFYINHKGEEVK